MVAAVSLLNDVVYDSRGCYTGLYYGESVWIVDLARNRVRVTALGMIRTWRSITRNVVEGGSDHSQYGYCD